MFLILIKNIDVSYKLLTIFVSLTHKQLDREEFAWLCRCEFHSNFVSLTS